MKWWRNWKVLREKRRITKRIGALARDWQDPTFTTTIEYAAEINRLVAEYNRLEYE